MLSFKRILKKTYKKSTTLQVHPFIIQESISKNFFPEIMRKASFFASFTRRFFKKRVGAFFTFEATIVLPVLIFVICAFFWFFTVFRVQMEVQGVLRTISGELSEYAFLYKEVRNFTNEGSEYIRLQDKGIERWLAGGITEVYVESKIKKQIGEKSGIWNYIEGGKDGIELKSFLRLPDEDGMIDLILTYEMKNPFLPGKIGETEYVQRSRVRAWTGYSYADEGIDEEAVDVVYITEYGEVYHTTRACTYLNISINSIAYIATSVIYDDRIYTECEACEEYGDYNASMVYVTNMGSKFHWTTSCRTLKRTIYEIPKEQASEYAPCSRCGKDTGE